MVVGPCIEVKAVEGDALRSYRDDGYLRTDFAVEPVLVHAEIGRRITKSDEPSAADAGFYCAARTAFWFARPCMGRARLTVGGQELLEGGESLIAPIRKGNAWGAPPIEGLRPGLVDGHDGLASCGSGRLETSCHSGAMMAGLRKTGRGRFAGNFGETARVLSVRRGEASASRTLLRRNQAHHLQARFDCAQRPSVPGCYRGHRFLRGEFGAQLLLFLGRPVPTDVLGQLRPALRPCVCSVDCAHPEEQRADYVGTMDDTLRREPFSRVRVASLDQGHENRSGLSVLHTHYPLHWIQTKVLEDYPKCREAMSSALYAARSRASP